VQVFQALLDHGTDIEAMTNSGKTPLHWACLHDYVAVVNELLSRGANTEAKDHDGDTPLHDASWNGHVAIVQVVLVTKHV
jgi:ankyrin repeat protein